MHGGSKTQHALQRKYMLARPSHAPLVRFASACISFIRLCEVHYILEIRVGCRRNPKLPRIGANAQIVNMAMADGLSNARTDLRDGLVRRRHCWVVEIPQTNLLLLGLEHNAESGALSRNVASHQSRMYSRVCSRRPAALAKAWAGNGSPVFFRVFLCFSRMLRVFLGLHRFAF